MIGVFGGTFDPVHFAHLRSALEVAEALDLTRVHLIPSGQPPHRDAPQVSAAHRLAMLQAAAAQELRFVVDERELKRAGPSYMVDTLASLREELPQQALCLILGVDAFLGLDRWHRWEQLFELCHIAVAHRPGYILSRTDGFIRQLGDRFCAPRQLTDDSVGQITQIPITALDISASGIRQRLQEGKSVHYLVPEVVYAYIKQQGLYQ